MNKHDFQLCGGAGVRVKPHTQGGSRGAAAPKLWVSTSLSNQDGCTRSRKRSYLRAVRRLEKTGQTNYRGKRFFRNKGWERASGAPEAVPAQGRCNFFTWNCGGLSPEILTEVLQWADDAQAHFFVLQETHWRHQLEWRSEGWLFVHSAALKARSGGVLFAVRETTCDHSTLRWRELIPGRLLHVRFQASKQQVDVLAIYQHVKIRGGKHELEKNIRERDRVWMQLRKCLDSLPERAFVIVAGDFNTSFSVSLPTTGHSAMDSAQPEVYAQEAKEVQSLLELTGMVVLNTFGKRKATFLHPGGRSMIDYICVKRAAADKQSRKSCAVVAPMAGWRKGGHRPVSASLALDWRPWMRAKPAAQMQEPRRIDSASSELAALKTTVNVFEDTQPPFKAPPIARPVGLAKRYWQQRELLYAMPRATLKDMLGRFQQYALVSKAQKALRKQARQARRDRVLSILEDAERAAGDGDSKLLYQCVRALSTGRPRARICLRGPSGELLSGEEEINLLADYAAKLFEGDTLQLDPLRPIDPSLLGVEVWLRALSSIKAGKAVPKGEPSVQAWKGDLVKHAERLSRISIDCLCCDTPFVPYDWSLVQIAWLPKPGKPPSAPRNLRTIGLMSVDSKSFLLVLREHIRDQVLQSLYDVPQYAYRPCMDTNDAILRAVHHCSHIRGMLQASVRNNTAKVVGETAPQLRGGLLISLDLAKAFDSVPHQELYCALLESGVNAELAQVLLQVHIQTQCLILHSNQGKYVGMSRGLRQGCPVAPIMYAAWTGRLCRQLNGALGAGWSQGHMTVFADDTLIFWSVQSWSSLRNAIKEAGRLMQILALAGVRINYEKSSCLLALTGTQKKKAYGSHVEWHRDGESLCVAVGSSQVRIPIVDQLPYLGIQLSYGRFEAQTIQTRIDRATTQFNALTSVLRTTSKFSRQQRLRIYKACVWSALRFGVLAAGLTQAGYNRIVTTLCLHLRKVLRVHEHGVSNQHILQQADLCPLEFFKTQAEQLCSRISQDTTRSPDILVLEATQLQEHCRELHGICDLQPHLTLVELDPKHGSVACGRCGLLFASEDGLTMHVLRKHPELHHHAGVPFNKRAHSLFGLSVCRLCRTHLNDWNSLRKHIACGTCSVLKDAAMHGHTIESVMSQVLQMEKVNPPEPPVPIEEVRHIHEFEPWMTSPLPQALEDVSLHRRLHQACALCSQRLVGMSRIKTHWKASHPLTWQLICHQVPGAMRSLKAAFSSPCRFCGSKARNPDQHCLQCPVVFQVCAVREVCRAQRLSEAMNESTGILARQDKANPAYLAHGIADSPIGRALCRSSSSSKTALGVAPTPTDSTQRPAETSTLRLATLATRQRSAPDADALSWTQRTILLNPGVLCYANSSILALMHVGERIGVQDPRLDCLRRDLLQAQQRGRGVNLCSLSGFEALARGWRFRGRQEDAAEFTHHILTALGLRVLWQSRLEEVEGVRVTDGGSMLFLQVPFSSCSLQELIEAWTFQNHVYALTGEWDKLPVVLGRYTRGRKNQARVVFDGDLQLPVFGNGRDLRQARYRVESALVHLGNEPECGHYRALLRGDGQWFYTDDGVPSTSIHLQREHACNVYLLWLVKQGL